MCSLPNSLRFHVFYASMFKNTYHFWRFLNRFKVPSPIVSSSFLWRYLLTRIKRVELIQSDCNNCNTYRREGVAFIFFYIFDRSHGHGGFNISLKKKSTRTIRGVACNLTLSTLKDFIVHKISEVCQDIPLKLALPGRGQRAVMCS